MRIPALLLSSALGLGLPALSAAPAALAAPSQGLSPRAGVTMSVVNFPSDPPGDQRMAPGGGRVLTPAIVYTPASGANPYSPVIVMLDQGPGSHPLEQGQATRFAAERLAAKGYTVMSLYAGQERGFPLVPLKDTAWAVRGALDYLEVAGYEDVVLAGQGYGAIAVANYLATQPDKLMDNGGERRVKAVVLFNPLTELRAYPRADLQHDYEARVAKAQASVASGRGLYPRNLMPGHSTGHHEDPWVLAGPYIAPAEGFLDYWGPQAAQRNAELLTQLPVPTLVLAGAKDPTVSVGKLRVLQTQARVDLHVYPEGQAHFQGLEARSSEDMATWLASQGLGPRPAVRTQALDVQTDGGRLLQGVLYTPAAKTPRKDTAIMFISGRTADTIQSSSHWMGWRFAQDGYATFAPGMRVSGAAGIQSSNLAEVAVDIGKWIDRAAALGYRRIVLAGHSNGGIWLSNYISLTHDKRVVGTMYFAPTLDEPTWAKARDGANYEANVARATAAVARGDGLREVIGLMTAQTYLDTSSPSSRALHSERVKEFKLPGLAIAGLKDELMSPAWITQFKASYAGPLKVVTYANGSHGFRENKDVLQQDVKTWMDATFR